MSVQQLRQPEAEKRFILTPYQLSQLVLFSDTQKTNGSKSSISFGALGGALSSEERSVLENFSQKVIDQNLGCDYLPQGFRGLAALARTYGEEEVGRVLEKIGASAELVIVTKDNLISPSSFSRLPQMVKLSLTQAGGGLFGQMRKFLKEGGIMTQVQFKRPAPVYLEAVDRHTKGITIRQKIAEAMVSDNPEIEKASHEFITVNFIPPSKDEANGQSKGTARHLTEIINRRIDSHFERDYARMVMLKAMLTKEMQSAVLSMIGVIACLPLLHWLNQKGEDKLVTQSLIKFIPPFMADMVTFYVQLGPWLEGETFVERMRDFAVKLATTHRRSLLTSLGATAAGSSLSEITTAEYGDVAGAIVYGLLPLVVAALTTIDTIESLRDKLKNASLIETIKIMFRNNPAHLGIDIGALTTFLTAVAVLGYGGQIHNPTAITIIEGAEEHGIATLITKLQTAFGVFYKFKAWAEKEIEDWLEQRTSSWE